jgi:hypothetical protein
MIKEDGDKGEGERGKGERGKGKGEREQGTGNRKTKFLLILLSFCPLPSAFSCN